MGKKCNFIFLVGGFARSGFLKTKIQDICKSKGIELICPSYPEQAVLMGAGLYALNPTIIGSRKSSLTYGVEASMAFEEGKDNPAYKTTGDSRNVAKIGSLFLSEEMMTLLLERLLRTITLLLLTVNRRWSLRYIQLTSSIRTILMAVNWKTKFTISLPGHGLDRTVVVTCRVDGAFIVKAKYQGQEKELPVRYTPYFS